MLVGLDRGLGAWIVTVPEPTPRNGEIWLRWRTKQCMLVALDRGLGAWAVTVPEPTLCILLPNFFICPVRWRLKHVVFIPHGDFKNVGICAQKAKILCAREAR